jgi:tetratricopeptide (TPR) repeat protein
MNCVKLKPDIVLVALMVCSLASGLAQSARDQTLFNDGKILIFDKKWPEARGVFERVIREYPRGSLVPQAYYYIARCFQFEGKQEEALKAYEVFLQKYPNEPFLPGEARNAVVELAASLFEKGNPAYRRQLETSLRDPNREVRYFAAIRCGQLKDRALTSSAIPVLKDIIARETEEDLVNRARIALMRLEPAALSTKAEAPPEPKKREKQEAKRDSRMFHLVVYQQGVSKPVVELNIPVSLAQLAVNALDESAKEEMRRKGFDVDNVWGDLKRLGPTNILTFRDEENTIKIWIQ